MQDHLGHTVREMVPNIAGQVEQLVQSIVASGEPVTGIEVSGQRADGVGADRCWLTNWYPLKGQSGRVLGVNVAAEEITERKRAQAAVVASEQRYRALFVERLRSEVTKAFQEQELAEMLDTRIK